MPNLAARDPSFATRLPWPFQPPFMLVWWAWVIWSWWSETSIAVRQLPPGLLDGRTGHLVPALIAGRAVGWLAEAGLYAIGWASRGTPLPYWRFVSWIASLSTMDVLGSALRRTAAHADPLGRAVAVLFAGPAAFEPGATRGWQVAFGSVGALALARVVVTAWAAARGTGRPLSRTLGVVGAAWIVTRIVTLWSFDLFKGMSPVR